MDDVQRYGDVQQPEAPAPAAEATAPAGASEAVPAWREVGDGRWVPYRIRGSWRGVLG
jgi:hypothetical protein